jgi:chromosome segregation ATPase
MDANCGISEEEQREIIAQINSIAEKNRQSLSAAVDVSDEKGIINYFKPHFEAKKSGNFFPILVNAAALVIIAGGFLALYGFQGKTDARVREGTKVYNTAERELIAAIRAETFSRLESKESEISQMSAKLEGVDSQLQALYADNKDLDADQLAAGNRLKSQQEEYRSSLALLQDERSRILEESRAREAGLQAQLESRTRELALVSEQTIVAIDLARGEMERLSREQAQAATVEAQMGALFANLNRKIRENQFDEALEIIHTMRSFLNTPAFQGLRSIQERKELYTQTINSFENMVETARRGPTPSTVVETVIVTDENVEKALADLRAKNTQLTRDVTQLEQTAREKDRTISALSSDDSKDRRIIELEGSLTAQRTMNAALETGAAEKNGQIRTLENQVTTLNQRVAARTTTITQIQNILQGGKSLADMSYNELNEMSAKLNEALGNQ